MAAAPAVRYTQDKPHPSLAIPLSVAVVAALALLGLRTVFMVALAVAAMMRRLAAPVRRVKVTLGLLAGLAASVVAVVGPGHPVPRLREILVGTVARV